ncbi:MAG: hypothetical protein NC209_07520 [Alistipes sp.]|nr:hypothetical protein [Alistipes senegalensis]MCM1250973.1 hypothetical protein [Alistipes sp.]
MKKLIPMLLGLLGTLPLQAQDDLLSPERLPARIPDYLYCEIVCSHLPVTGGNSVIFDVGQKIGYWRYEILNDAEGRAYLFNSGIQALNYMTSRGWEFVQAYTSGEKHNKTHFLLRIASDELPEEAVRDMLALPRSKKREAAQKEEEE